MSEERALTVREAADRAGVSVDGIRRAYRSGALAAYRPGGRQRVVIRPEDLDAWAFSEETRVSASTAGLRPVGEVDPPSVRPAARRRSRRPAPAGSVERLLEIERRA